VSVATSKARLAGLIAHREPDDPAIAAARHALAVANLEASVERAVAAAPPLTDGQRVKLAAILLSPGTPG
jgi:hypothetical protein